MSKRFFEKLWPREEPRFIFDQIGKDKILVPAMYDRHRVPWDFAFLKDVLFATVAIVTQQTDLETAVQQLQAAIKDT